MVTALRSGFQLSVIGALSLWLGGCAITPDADETGALAKAAAAFKTQATATSPIPAANASVAKAALLRGLVQANPPAYSTTCYDAVSAWNQQVAQAAQGTAANEDAAYKQVDKIAPCGPFAPPAANAPPPLPIVAALDSYFDGLQAIVAAKDTDAVVTASTSLATSTAALAKAANAPAPVQAAPGVFAKLATMALADAQYEALSKAVLDVDPLLDAATPPLVSALRVQQSFWASEVASDAAIGMTAINGALSDPAVKGDLTLRLALYDRVTPILDEFSQEQAASRTDPAAAVHGLMDAHHKLAAALKSNRGQLQAIIGNVIDIASSAQSLIGSTPPKAATGAAAHG